MKQFEMTRLFLPVMGLFGLATTAQAQADLYTIQGVGAEDLMGMAVGPAGRYNADTNRDIIAGAPENFIIFTAGNGRASVHDGTTGSVITTFFGDDTFDQFGLAVDGGFDYNNDGRDDVIVGARLASPGVAAAGVARIFSGANNMLLHEIAGTSVSEHLGESVSGCGDVNNDGFDDVIVGSPGYSNPNPDTGKAQVISGFDNSVIWTVMGTGADDSFGVSVCGMGDLNGDNFDEFAVGSNFDGVKIYNGATGGIWLNLPALQRDDFYGGAIGCAGDVNGDNVNDIVIGASQRAGLIAQPGYAEIRSGFTGGLIHTETGDNPGDRMGISVDGAGDLNGDGRHEVIIGADQLGEGANGYARVLNGMTLATMFDITSANPNNNILLGASVAGLGDVNGDGSLEVAAGQPLDGLPPGIIARGSVRVVSGPGGGGGPPAPTTYCVAGTNSSGTQALMGSLGTTSIAANDFILTVDGAVPNGFGLFFYGPNQLPAFIIPGTSSFRCVGGGIFRLGGGISFPNGSNLRPVDYNFGNPSRGAGMIVAGSTWNFAYVYRDAFDVGAVPLNYSNGLSATFVP